MLFRLQPMMYFMLHEQSLGVLQLNDMFLMSKIIMLFYICAYEISINNYFSDVVHGLGATH